MKVLSEKMIDIYDYKRNLSIVKKLRILDADCTEKQICYNFISIVIHTIYYKYYFFLKTDI